MSDVNNAYWLTPGAQTEITDLVRGHADKIRQVYRSEPVRFSDYPEFVAAYKTGYYVKRHVFLHSIYATIKNIEHEQETTLYLRPDSQEKFYKDLITAADERFCRQRTADQILREGRFGFCSDKAILFRALMIAQGFPVSYLEMLKVTDYGEGNSKDFKSHAATRVYAKDKTIIYDPIEETGFDSELSYFDSSRQTLIAEGLDSWDVGIHSKKDLEDFLKKHSEEAERRAEELHIKIMADPAFV